jgi:hypothetical protein
MITVMSVLLTLLVGVLCCGALWVILWVAGMIISPRVISVNARGWIYLVAFLLFLLWALPHLGLVKV